MHSVDLLEEALRLAMNSGYRIRQEWLKEQGGGACRIGGEWVLFVDLSVSAQEQLATVINALRNCAFCEFPNDLSPELRAMLTAEEKQENCDG